MITINFSSDDLTKLRFAYRPLLEVPLSYRVLNNPDFQSPYLKWVDEAQRSLYDLDLPYMHAVMPPAGYIPDFLTPPPEVNRLDIYADIEDMRATPDTLIQQDILELIAEHGDSEIRRHFLVHPREALECLADEMRLYWQRVLAHYWSHMVSTLEGDILYHARMLVLDGPGKVFDDLHPTISYQRNRLDIRPACQCLHPTTNLSLDGRGIQLVPVVFKGCGRMYQIKPDWQPMVAYGVHGAGLWYKQKQPSNRALEIALGAGRARVLIALRTPKSNGELARTLRITTGAVSQHLARLLQAGLVESHRMGKRVFFQLTWRGEDLIRLFDGIP